MAESGSKILNDPIHGNIELPPLCVKIIDTPEFQRLRYIKQLGACYYVYPGASHNRFEHSIGVCHLAGEMVNSLMAGRTDFQISPRDKLCVQIAGLCHDLGHGPFSHLFDGMFIPRVNPDSDWKHEKGSEDMFERLLRHNKLKLRENEEENKADVEFIKELINPPKEEKNLKGRGPGKEFLYQIISNKDTGIDVDKWDYFARDCHHLGMKSMFDHQRLMKFSRVIMNENKVKICYRDKEAGNIYDMFHTRAMLHQRAYQHKTNKVIEEMIADAFKAADKHLRIGGKKRKLSECIDDMEAYTQLDDTLFQRILYSTDDKLDPAQKILKRIQTRNFYKCVGKTKPKELKKPNEIKINGESEMEANDANLKGNILITVCNFDYGKKDQDPVANARFYSKDDIDKAKPISPDQVSSMLPAKFQDQKIRAYCRSNDPKILEKAERAFKKWCRKYPIVEDAQNP